MTRHDVTLHSLQLGRCAMPIKHHYIQEWAALRGWRQSDVLKQLSAIDDKGSDKSLVSRWWRGTVPTDENLDRLAKIFELDRPELLLRHPDEVWALRYVEELAPSEQSAIRTAVEGFKKTASK